MGARAHNVRTVPETSNRRALFTPMSTLTSDSKYAEAQIYALVKKG